MKPQTSSGNYGCECSYIKGDLHMIKAGIIKRMEFIINRVCIILKHIKYERKKRRCH